MKVVCIKRVAPYYVGNILTVKEEQKVFYKFQGNVDLYDKKYFAEINDKGFNRDCIKKIEATIVHLLYILERKANLQQNEVGDILNLKCDVERLLVLKEKFK